MRRGLSRRRVLSSPRTGVVALLVGVCVFLVYYSKTTTKPGPPYNVRTGTSRGDTRYTEWPPVEWRPNRPDLEFPWMPDPCGRRRVSSQVEDILCMKRPKFLADYKNPCWRTEGGKLRCLPYFHIIGCAKGATTDLLRRMLLHPEIVKNRAIRDKETWYWSWGRYAKAPHRNLTMMPFGEFLDNFNVTPIEENHQNGFHYLVTGHGDPMDFTDFYWNHLIPQNDPEAEELVWTTPFLIKHVNPGVKLLLIMREPVDRLYSYYYFKGEGNTSLDFHNDVIESIKVWSDCRKSHSERHCLYDFSTNKERMKVALYSSFYSAHLKEWLKVFPRDQILLLRTEDYHSDQVGTLRQVYKFLNITTLPDEILELAGKLERAFVTERKIAAGPMMPETRRILTDLYREPNRALAELVGDKRFAFTDMPLL